MMMMMIRNSKPKIRERKAEILNAGRGHAAADARGEGRGRASPPLAGAEGTPIKIISA